jgi:hypothetical protein
MVATLHGTVEELGLLDANRSQLWIISVGVLHALLIFRINRV